MKSNKKYVAKKFRQILYDIGVFKRKFLKVYLFILSNGVYHLLKLVICYDFFLILINFKIYT